MTFDVTNPKTSRAARAHAKALGLLAFFDTYKDQTGTVVLLDGKSHKTLARLYGDTELSHYTTAINESLR